MLMKSKYRFLKKIVVSMAVMFGFILQTTPNCFASGYTVTIPINQTADIPQETNNQFSYEITSQGMPMPEGSKDGSYLFDMTGTAKHDIKIIYSHAGVYQYKIRQQIKSQDERYDFDKRIYTVTVHITNSNDGLTGKIYTSLDTGKVDSGIEFKNSYLAMPEAPDDSGKDNNSGNLQDKKDNDSGNQDKPENLGKTDKDTDSKKSGINYVSNVTNKINTGDSTYVSHWIILGSISAFCFVVLTIMKRKGKHLDE